MRRLPDDFLLGCATSAYQVEGGITNDWSAWEAAGRLKDPTERCGLATDHWHRWEEDFARLTELGANAYRLSLEWARIEPEPGRFDGAALDRYRRMLEHLRARGVEPIVTLLHFTHPTWFHVECPWHDPSGEAVHRFERFVTAVMSALGPLARRFTVLNEPGPWLAGAYVAGVIPPGMKILGDPPGGGLRARLAHPFVGLGALVTAFTMLVRGHAAAYRAIKRAVPDAEVGLAHNVLRFEPSRAWHPADRVAAAWLADVYNHAFPRALVEGRAQLGVVPGVRADAPVPEARGTLDFLGVNYYSRVFLELGALGDTNGAAFYDGRGEAGVSDLGWEIHPRGLTEALLELRRYRVPLLVTENGLDDRDDTRRAAFLHDHLAAVLDARDQGADVRGYLHWSLLDNFEWLEGFGPSFGLYAVDRRTLERRPTSAARLFQTITRERALPTKRPSATVRRGGRTRLF